MGFIFCFHPSSIGDCLCFVFPNNVMSKGYSYNHRGRQNDQYYRSERHYDRGHSSYRDRNPYYEERDYQGHPGTLRSSDPYHDRFRHKESMRSSHDGYSRRDRGNHHNSPYPRHPPPQHSNGHRNHYMNSSQPLRPKIDYNTPISEMVSPYNVGSRPVHPRIVPPRLQEEKLSDQDHIKEYKECISKKLEQRTQYLEIKLKGEQILSHHKNVELEIESLERKMMHLQRQKANIEESLKKLEEPTL